jgi:predicted glycogen debranching enzyme
LGIRFGRDACGEYETAHRKEWLVTNGLGGYASGTVGGALTRRYHGLLVAALSPPVGRTLLVPKFDEFAAYRGRIYPLGTNRWADGTVDPAGFVNIESFEVDGTAPVWRFALADAIVERRIWMPHGANATCVRYALVRASAPVDLEIDVFVDDRDHHGSTTAGASTLAVEARDDGFAFTGGSGAVRGCVTCEGADWHVEPAWYFGFDLERERERGLDPCEDHLRAARAAIRLSEGRSITIAMRALPDPVPALDASWQAFARRASSLDARWSADGHAADAPGWIRRLVLAADQLIVAREGGSTVIAGYPWFTDWGRDTMISLPGLALATGRPEIARSILLTFARHVDGGMIPNRFPDGGGAPEYNTVDATLWFFSAVRELLTRTGDDALAVELYPTLAEIVRCHLRGTRYGIRCDPADGLLAAGEQGMQLTWMDAKVGDRVVTPRIGKAVEVNALWLNALGTMALVAEKAGRPRDPYDRLAAAAGVGFARFWNESLGCCYDVIDGPDGVDAKLRPNQIFAASLPDTALSDDQICAVVDACGRELVTSYGLRSLSPSDAAYRGTYDGDPSRRDDAYHQGTVWGYLLGPFALAHYRAYGDAKASLSFLRPMEDALESYGLGTLPEIFDGDAPMRPRGCIAQAWTVAETLRAWMVLATEAKK